MFDGFTKSKFYTKCKLSIKTTKTRLEALKKKKNTVAKYLKNDMADLLKNDLDYKAFGRAEGLMAEQNMIVRYDFIEQFCECISSNLSVMSKQRECPEECREAVHSLIYAAARFSEFPELRDLRSLFIERYQTSPESFINKEFVEALRPKPATKKMKLQLMHEIAQEFSIDWNSKSLEQKLFKPLANQEDLHRNGSVDDVVDNPRRESQDDGSVDDVVDDPKRESQDDHEEYKLKKNKADIFKKRDDYHLATRGNERSNIADEIYKAQSSSEDEVTSSGTERGSLKASASSAGSVPEDEVDSKSIYYRSIPPPYVKTKTEIQEKIEESPKSSCSTPGDETDHPDGSNFEAKPKPRSVRRRPLKSLSGQEDCGSVEKPLKPPPGREKIGSIGSEMLATKKSTAVDQDSSNLKPYLKPPPSWEINKDNGEVARPRSTKSEIPLVPGKETYPAEPVTPSEATKRHSRSTSLQPEMLTAHVHPNLPDCDDLAARIAAFKGR